MNYERTGSQDLRIDRIVVDDEQVIHVCCFLMIAGDQCSASPFVTSAMAVKGIRPTVEILRQGGARSNPQMSYLSLAYLRYERPSPSAITEHTRRCTSGYPIACSLFSGLSKRVVRERYLAVSR